MRKILAYIQGWYRYNLWYSQDKFGINLKGWIRPHIQEQIEMRIKSMRRSCYRNGSCDECGCKTTALQMANKACDGNCYPPMFNRLSWNVFKEASKRPIITFIKKGKYGWRIECGKFKNNAKLVKQKY